MNRMKVSLDGGKTFVEIINEVRVIYEQIDVPGEAARGELHVTLTHEGIISDVWVEPRDQNIGTHSSTVDEWVEKLVANGH